MSFYWFVWELSLKRYNETFGEIRTKLNLLLNFVWMKNCCRQELFIYCSQERNFFRYSIYPSNQSWINWCSLFYYYARKLPSRTKILNETILKKVHYLYLGRTAQQSLARYYLIITETVGLAKLWPINGLFKGSERANPNDDQWN